MAATDTDSPTPARVSTEKGTFKSISGIFSTSVDPAQDQLRAPDRAEPSQTRDRVAQRTRGNKDVDSAEPPIASQFGTIIGYPRLAAFVNSDENFQIYRRFGFLQARTLLDIQNELGLLEKELDKLDRSETYDFFGRTYKGALDTARPDRRPRILADLEKKLLDYSKILTGLRGDPESAPEDRDGASSARKGDFCELSHNAQALKNSSKPRRRRGKRKKNASRNENNEQEEDPFDKREVVFNIRDDVNMPALANIDTGLKVPGGLLMASQYAKELGRFEDISQDFEGGSLKCISGHSIPIIGILRNVIFRIKGTSVTFRRDFYICDAINNVVDVMFGASFIKDHFRLLFEKVKGFCSSCAALAFNKESAEEKVEKEKLNIEQKRQAEKQEAARRKKEQEDEEAKMAMRTQSQAAAGRRQ